jgi:hypothetical protein
MGDTSPAARGLGAVVADVCVLAFVTTAAPIDDLSVVL